MSFAGITVDTSDGLNTFPPVNGSTELYRRHVSATNATVTEDEECMIDASVGHLHGRTSSSEGFALSSVPGRGGNGRDM